MFLYKFLDQNQETEPRIKYKVKKGKLVPITENLTYQERLLLDLSKFIKKEKVIADEDKNSSKGGKDKRDYKFKYSFRFTWENDLSSCEKRIFGVRSRKHFLEIDI